MSSNNEKSEQEFQKKLKNLVEKDIKQHSQYLWIGEKFVSQPLIIILIWIVLFILGIVLSLSFDSFEMAEQNRREFLIWDNERVKAKDMQVQMMEEFQKGLGETQIPERTQDEADWATHLMLHCGDDDDCNLFTKEGLKTLFAYEQKITNHEDYGKLCLGSVASTECNEKAFLTISKFITLFLKKLPSQLSDQDVEMFGNLMFMDETRFEQLKFFFDKDFNATNRVAKNIRSFARFGTPLQINGELKKDKYDDRDDQKDKLNDFQEEILDIRDNSDIETPSGWNLYTYSTRMATIEFNRVVDKDILWAIASVGFCLVYMSVHLRSIFLGCAVMAQIILSFPLAQTIFDLVLGVSYWSSLHVAVIFIVLGISAANIFVFVDAWEQTGLYYQFDKDPIKKMNQRMAYTYRRAGKSMLATQSTTSAAFLAISFSDVMPIASFGIYATVLIILNFLLMILFFPAIFMIYEKHMSDKKICCCLKKEEKSDTKNLKSLDKLHDLNENELNFVEKFFGNHFNSFIQKFSYAILFIIFVWIGIATWQALQIGPLSEPERFLQDDHKATIARKKAFYDFHPSGSGDTGIVVYQFWGVDGIDNSDTSKWNVNELGKVEWDEEFDLSPEKNQQFFYNYCLNLTKNPLVQDQRVFSFIFDFKNFAETSTPEKKFPVSQAKFMLYLAQFVQTPLGFAHYYQNRIGIIKQELKYVQIKISSIGTPFKPYDDLNPIYEEWDDFISETNEKAPKGLKNSKQSGGLHWTWMVTERAFVSNAVRGMLISLGFGLIVLVAATNNIIVAVLSLLSIAGIVVSVMGVMSIADWELGVAESITIVVVIGLSIDYVVHLANHYVESVYTDRHRKIKVALRDLGISIMSGAFTTAGSGLFLFFADMVIFNKFASLIISTVLFSLLFSLFFFSSLMHALGPEDDVGSIFKSKNIIEGEQYIEDIQKDDQQEQQQKQENYPQVLISEQEELVVKPLNKNPQATLEEKLQSPAKAIFKQEKDSVGDDVEKHIVKN